MRQMLIVLGILIIFGCGLFPSEDSTSTDSSGEEPTSGGSGSGGGTDTSTPDTCEYYALYHLSYYPEWVQSDYYGEPIAGGKQKVGPSFPEWDGYFDSGRRDHKWDPGGVECYTGYICLNSRIASTSWLAQRVAKTTFLPNTPANISQHGLLRTQEFLGAFGTRVI